MGIELTEAFVTKCLQRAYRTGVIASTDGYAEMYEGVPLKCAAVLIPLVRWEGEWQLVFTRRAETVEHHKGQVSFPGGACDGGEATPEETALREAREEIGLEPDDARLLGRLNDVVTITRYRVTPVVAVMPWPYRLRLAPDEVGRAFTIPLTWLAERRNRDEQQVWPDGTPRPSPLIVYQPFDGEVLWGASARITLNFLSVLGL